ncbi:response regulator [Sphingobium bisphenolivorans]|uniref:response regulator n=1 Tax=Sphingobium bisphenolivorans TaxID=1335760 RepID=UPI0003A960D1|nr:response regulator [Sphingobium bisphenolivorans]
MSAERILVVEDDPILASIIAELLTDADYEVDGPYASLSDGVAALASDFPDGAVLEIRLGGGDVGMLAEDLKSYDIPFLFCSGFADDRLTRHLPDAPLVPKVTLSQTLVPVLDKLLH